MTGALSWVVGRGGMLGSHVEAALERAGCPVWVPARTIPWTDGVAALDVLADERRAFLDAAGDGAWQVLWCAGAGVTGTSADVLELEVATFASFLDGLDPQPGQDGSLFLASSAGGAYAGSTAAPFDERSRPQPLSPYGEAKLAMEAAATRWAQRVAGRLLIGRIGNLYGPGQQLDKPQGLIAQLLRSHLQRAPLRLYVPLDTIRDLVYVEDAARKIVLSARRLRDEPAGEPVLKVIASQRGTTIGAVIGEMGRVLRRRPQIILASSPVSRYQATDLRLRSVVWTEIDRLPLTPFPVGIHATLEDVSRRLQRASLDAAG